MKELNDYDTMMLSYYKSAVSSAVLPLSSWDLHSAQYAFVMSHKEDFSLLRKLTKDWDMERDYYNELINKKSTIVITTPKLSIVYASQNMTKMNGYTPEEVIGKSPKMFQGPGTCMETSNKIRTAVSEEKPFEYTILNYRKDSSIYECEIKGYPVYDKKGNFVNYIAFEKVA